MSAGQIDPASSRWHIWLKQIPLLGIIFGLAAIFFELGSDILMQQGFAWDVTINAFIQQFRHPWLDQVMLVVTATGGTVSVILVCCLAIWLILKHRNADMVTLLVSYVGGVLLSDLLKLAFARPRPFINTIIAVSGYSFPSGHTTTAVVFYGLLAFYYWTKKLRGLAVLLIFWIIAIGFSRIYLLVHYPSDVLGAFAVGGLWIIAVIEFRGWYDRHLVMRQMPE